MDGSSHPDPPKITEIESNNYIEPNAKPFEVNDASTVLKSNTAPHSGSKRSHEQNDHPDSRNKRLNVSSDDEDDLDLEALMAHLQRHTEQHPEQSTESRDLSSSAQSPRSRSNPEDGFEEEEKNNHIATDSCKSPRSNSPQSDCDDEESDDESAAETEMSIAAQLRGALSSLQELNTNDSDDIDLDEITQLLQSAQVKPVSDQSKSPDYTETNNTSADNSEVAAQSVGPFTGSNERQMKSILSSREFALQNGLVRRKDPAESKREELMLRMPSPPAHLETLPPMPPPPPAFTSPIASYTASKIARDRAHLTPLVSEPSRLSGRLSTAQPRVSSVSNSQNLAHKTAIVNHSVTESSTKFPEPSFSEVSGVSEDYGSMLADEIDGVFNQEADFSSATSGVASTASEVPEQPFPAPQTVTAPLSHVALHLNTNKAILETRKRSILLLDSLACQILDTLSFSHYQDTLTTVMQPESDRGMAYRILLDAFEDLKRIYLKWETPSSRNQPEPKVAEVRPFLSYDVPGIEATRDNFVTIQRVNLATFVAAVFGSIEIGFYELNDWFTRVFVPENGRLLKQQCNIYLDLKTQAYISALETSDNVEAQQEALEHLFPANLEAQLQAMLGDRIALVPTERDFVAKCNRRKENIKSEDSKSLPMKYHWVPFLKDISEYVSRNHYALLPQRRHSIVPTEIEAHPSPASALSVRQYTSNRRQASASTQKATPAPAESSTPAMAGDGDSGQLHSPHSISEPSTTHSEVAVSSNSNAENDVTNPTIVEVSVAAPSNDPARDRSQDLKLEPIDTQPSEQMLSSAREINSVDKTSRAGPPTKSPSAPPDSLPILPSESSDRASSVTKYPSIPSEGHPLFPPLPKQVLPRPLPSRTSAESVDRERTRRPGPRNQPLPDVSVNSGSSNTLAVYEAARASAEGTDLVRPKVSLYTTRRTWTKEEEEALLKGMDRVQGPYWAQILELYGPGGKINEVLKDRTQVQLKDKARNLKMFFVRLGLPIPAVFQYVTGDYETRKSSSKRVRDKKQLKAASAVTTVPTLPTGYPANQSRQQGLSSNMHPSGATGLSQSISHNVSPGIQIPVAAAYSNAQHAPTNLPTSSPSVSNSLPNSQLNVNNSSHTTSGRVTRGQDHGQAVMSHTTSISTADTESLIRCPQIGEHQQILPTNRSFNGAAANTNHSVQIPTQKTSASTGDNSAPSLLSSNSFSTENIDQPSPSSHALNKERPSIATIGVGLTSPPQPKIAAPALSTKTSNEIVLAQAAPEPTKSSQLEQQQAIDSGSTAFEKEAKVLNSPVDIELPPQPSTITAIEPVSVSGHGRADLEDEDNEEPEDDDELSNLLDRVGQYVENN